MPPPSTSAPPAPASPAALAPASPAALAPASLAPTTPAPLAGSAAHTPTRDVFVDAVRVLATLCVITVHWLMAEASWDGAVLRVGNALGHGHAWLVTWLLQVLPLLFFAAGAAACLRDARHDPTTHPGHLRLLGHALRRLLPPVAVFIGVWALGAVAMLRIGVPDDAVWRAVRIAPQLLWFLGVYLILLALTPVVLRSYRTHGLRLVTALIAAAFGVDLLRFGFGVEWLAPANLLLVWAVPYVLGIAYAEGRRRGALPTRWALCMAAVIGLTAAAALVAYGPYPTSLIGLPGQALSNLGPPTAPVVAHAVFLVSLCLLGRAVIVRWAQGPGAGVVRWVGTHSMTLYLWHLTAMFVVVGVVLLALDGSLPQPWSTAWWWSRPLWFGANIAVLALLVRCLGGVETRRPDPASGALPWPGDHRRGAVPPHP